MERAPRRLLRSRLAWELPTRQRLYQPRFTSILLDIASSAGRFLANIHPTSNNGWVNIFLLIDFTRGDTYLALDQKNGSDADSHEKDDGHDDGDLIEETRGHKMESAPSNGMNEGREK